MWQQSDVFRKGHPAGECGLDLASSKRGLVNADVSLEILQDKIALRLKSVEGVFQSSAKLAENEHAEQ